MPEESKPKRARPNPNLAFVLEPSIRARLDKLAADEDRSVSYIARRALVEHLEKLGY
ncbi:MAG: CopG family transcriptional regulator [Dolichospermum sp. DEX182a]|jgi:predicted transcriptional regulator|nr:CopG family transcriptional regulator [Dolichospermum sp. DEX182a]